MSGKHKKDNADVLFTGDLAHSLNFLFLLASPT